jgi:hypothetical protein
MKYSRTLYVSADISKDLNSLYHKDEENKGFTINTTHNNPAGIRRKRRTKNLLSLAFHHKTPLEPYSN